MVQRRDDQRLNRRAARGPSPAVPTRAASEHVSTDTPPDNPTGENANANTPGHPEARGTLPMAHRLTDPAIEEEIQALAAEAPLPTVDQAARLARLLRLGRPRDADAA